MKSESKEWIELFVDGSVYVLEIKENYLIAIFTGDETSDYEADELVNNGVFDIYEKARMMHKHLIFDNVNIRTMRQ